MDNVFLANMKMTLQKSKGITGLGSIDYATNNFLFRARITEDKVIQLSCHLLPPSQVKFLSHEIQERQRKEPEELKRQQEGKGNQQKDEIRKATRTRETEREDEPLILLPLGAELTDFKNTYSSALLGIRKVQLHY